MNFIDKYILRRANKLQKRNTTQSSTVVNTTAGTLSEILSQSSDRAAVYGVSETLTISAAFACVEMISNSVALLPLRPFVMTDKGKELAVNDSTFEMLTSTPNEQMTRYDLLDVLVKSTILYGNGYAKVVRDTSSGVGKAIYFQDSRDVVAFIIDGDNGRQIDHYYNVRTGEVIEPNDMIHIKNFTLDGIEGVSTIKYACYSLGLAKASELHASNFYHSGGALSGILSIVDGRLTSAKREQIRQEWRTQVAADSIAVLDGDMRYQPISVSPDDAQLLQSRQFSVVDVCRFFKVSPVKIFDLTHSSYSTVEAVNTSFLVDTLSSYLERIELEFRRKIYPPIKRARMHIDFDTRNITKADITAQSNLYRNLSTIGAVTPNEVREAFALPPIEGGDKAYMQINMQSIDNIDSIDNNLRDERQQ